MPWVRKQALSPCGLKGRENLRWIAPNGEQISRGLSGRFGFVVPSSQGIGLRPQKPWAGISRPVGPLFSGAPRTQAVGPAHYSTRLNSRFPGILSNAHGASVLR